MTRGEVAYKLKHKGYTFKRLGQLFNVSRQCAHGLYWRHWKKISKTDQRTCDVCGVISDDVAWQWSHYKLCEDCRTEILKLRKTKYSREEYEERRIRNLRGRKRDLSKQNP